MNAPPKFGDFRDTQVVARAEGQRDIPYREASLGRDCMWPSWSAAETSGCVCGLPVDATHGVQYRYCSGHMRVAYPAGVPDPTKKKRPRR